MIGQPGNLPSRRSLMDRALSSFNGKISFRNDPNRLATRAIGEALSLLRIPYGWQDVIRN